jgi:hypothetical protein
VLSIPLLIPSLFFVKFFPFYFQFFFNLLIASIVCCSRENCILGFNSGLRPPSELLSGYLFVLYQKSIGRFYSTCNLQESSHETTPLAGWAQPFSPGESSLGGSQTHTPLYRDWQRSFRLSFLLSSLCEGVLFFSLRFSLLISSLIRSFVILNTHPPATFLYVVVQCAALEKIVFWASTVGFGHRQSCFPATCSFSIKVMSSRLSQIPERKRGNALVVKVGLMHIPTTSREM